jgi:hypothetical protein
MVKEEGTGGDAAPPTGHLQIKIKLQDGDSIEFRKGDEVRKGTNAPSLL